ncbi:MAG: HAD hydrolase-like protein [Saprospiraceae bacterium]|nr:HAD hydrolase-like protein [Saprospiraceae bacterium]
MDKLELVVFDMAGTTFKDPSIISASIKQAAVQSGLDAKMKEVEKLQGLSITDAVYQLWVDEVGEKSNKIESKASGTYTLLMAILENYYRTHEVLATDGTIETFSWLRTNNIKVALTSSLNRNITNIILKRLGWDRGLNDEFVAEGPAVVDLSLTPDEVGGKGRPHPDMILKAMEILEVKDPEHVIKVGDTPADLKAGKAAGCGMSIAVTNGAFDKVQLMEHDNDGLINSMTDFKEFVLANVGEKITI